MKNIFLLEKNIPPHDEGGLKTKLEISEDLIYFNSWMIIALKKYIYCRSSKVSKAD